MSAMKGWTPNNMDSDKGSSFCVNSFGATHQPLRNPGAACDLEMDATAIVRSASSGLSRGEENLPSKISSS